MEGNYCRPHPASWEKLWFNGEGRNEKRLQKGGPKSKEKGAGTEQIEQREKKKSHSEKMVPISPGLKLLGREPSYGLAARKKGGKQQRLICGEKKRTGASASKTKKGAWRWGGTTAASNRTGTGDKEARGGGGVYHSGGGGLHHANRGGSI